MLEETPSISASRGVFVNPLNEVFQHISLIKWTVNPLLEVLTFMYDMNLKALEKRIQNMILSYQSRNLCLIYNQCNKCNSKCITSVS